MIRQHTDIYDSITAVMFREPRICAMCTMYSGVKEIHSSDTIGQDKNIYYNQSTKYIII